MKKTDGIRILVVEDELIVAEAVSRQLEKLGYSVVDILDTGEAAVDCIHNDSPDLVLMDIKLAGKIDGIEAASRIRARDDVPVIYLTAYSDERTLKRAQITEPFGYLVKPFQIRELHSVIRMGLYRHELENKLKQSHAQLAELNASKDRFFSIISHDLRSPFTSIMGFSQLLVESIDEIPPDQIKEICSLLYQSAEKYYRLIENLLEWSQLQQGQMRTKPEKCDLRELMEQNVALYHDITETREISIQNNVSAGTIVFGDPNMLDTVLRNLIDNAVKYTRDGGHITLSACVGEMVEVLIEDDGVGIAPEDQVKLFRLDTSHKTKDMFGRQGSGLGLLLCKELIEKNGGSIRLESEEDKGSTFVFTMPAWRAE